MAGPLENDPSKPVYKAGDCLALRLRNGQYGAAVVLGLDTLHGSEALNLIGVLRYMSEKVPSLAVFERREWLRLTHHSWNNKLLLRRCLARHFEKDAALFDVVGQTEIRSDDPRESRMVSDWRSLCDQILLQYQFEAEGK